MKWMGHCLLGMALGMGSAAAWADYTAVALYAPKQVGGWGTGATQAEAEAAALAVCAQAHPRCAIRYTAAVAVATDSEMLASSISYRSRTEAEREALAGCGEPACEIAATVEAPGLYALFTVHQGEDMVGLYLRHGLTSQEQAITQAQQQCEQRDGLRCTLSRWGAIRGELPGTGTPREIYAVQTDAN